MEDKHEQADIAEAQLATGGEPAMTAEEMPKVKYDGMTLSELARTIRRDWKTINYAARPYVDAMADMLTLHDKFWLEGASEIVLRFLSNAATWRGPVARDVKKELNRQLKAHKQPQDPERWDGQS